MPQPPPRADTSGEQPPPHTIFLSYSRTDQKNAVLVLKVLEAAGYSVWWDGLLEGGERFSRTTATALDSARAVLVLWSETSIGSHWVHDEATRGRDTGRLVPLSLDGSLPPLGFGQFQSIDLSGSLTRLDSKPIQKMLRAVAVLHEHPVKPMAPRPATAGSRATATRRRMLVGGGAAIAAAGAGVALWKWSGLFADQAPPRSIAVLPFANLSGDPEQRYFSDGLTSEIRTQLSRNSLLQIVGQTSSERAGQEKGDTRKVARELGAAFLLDGNVQKAGGRVKIVAELADGATGLSRWAQTYERPIADIFAVQTEIGTAVASALSAAIGSEDGNPPDAQVGGTRSIPAFDAYLRGRDLYEAGVDEASDRAALAYFDRAIALDGNYANAYAARSRSLVIIGNLYADHSERVRTYDAAIAAAARATRLAPTFGEAFSALGFALASGKLDMRAARAPFERSFELAPGSADILSRYATFRSNLRDYARAKSVIQQATKLDPLNARTFRSSGDIRYGGRDFTGAIAAFQKAITLNPTLAGVHNSLGFAQLMLGELDAANASFAAEKSAVRRLPGQAIVAFRKGDRAAARAALDALTSEYGDKSNYQYAQVHAQWGDRVAALAALRKALELRDGGIMLMYNDPLLDPLRNTPEFDALAKRIGFV